MGSEVLPSTQQNTTTHRPVLFRLEHTNTEPVLQDWCERVSAAGFDEIELVLEARQPDDAPNSPQPRPRRLERRMFSDVHVGALAARCTSIDAPCAVEEVRVLLRQAADLRATCLNLTIPPVAHASEEVSFSRYQDALNLAYMLLHVARHEAEATGVAIALEAAANRSLLSPVELREIIDAANSWAVGVCIDVDRIAQIGCPVDWIRTLRHRVHAVRLSDVQLADSADETGVQRSVSIARVANALDEIACDRPIIVSSQCEPGQTRIRVTRLLGMGASTNASV